MESASIWKGLKLGKETILKLGWIRYSRLFGWEIENCESIKKEKKAKQKKQQKNI